MSALRLEVETHIVTASATAVQNLTKCVQLAGVKIDELVVNGLASAEAVADRDREGAGRRGRRHRRRHDRPRAVLGGLAVPHGRAAGRRQQRDQRRRDRRQDDAPGRRGAQGPARDVRPAGHRRGRGDLASRCSARTPGAPSAARSCAGSSRPDARDVRAARAGDDPAAARACCRRGSSSRAAAAQLAGTARARPRGPPDAGPRRRPDRDRRPRRHDPGPARTRPRRAAPLGRRRMLAAGEPARYESAPAAGGIGRIRSAIRSIFP